MADSRQIGESGLDKSQEVGYTNAVPLKERGDRSSIGRALDCGSSGCGFKPHRSPFLLPLSLCMWKNSPGSALQESYGTLTRILRHSE